ncbi:hypothetical protein M2281_005384 [Mesorhizobium soli]|nr:hypothetical protein [Mesorhizobium soli]
MRVQLIEDKPEMVSALVCHNMIVAHVSIIAEPTCDLW